MQALFTGLITLQFLIILLHDLVEIPGWPHPNQVRAVLGGHKLWLATLANPIFPGLAVGFAFNFWHRPAPVFVDRYWAIYCSVTVDAAIAMWYLPLLFRGPREAEGRVPALLCRYPPDSARPWHQPTS